MMGCVTDLLLYFIYFLQVKSAAVHTFRTIISFLNPLGLSHVLSGKEHIGSIWERKANLVMDWTSLTVHKNRTRWITN